MSALAMDARGLLPPGIHTVTWQDIEDTFLFNLHRSKLYHDLRAFIEADLRSRAPGLRLILGGSFFSDKQQPDDIECCMPIPPIPAQISACAELLAWAPLNHDRIKKEHRIDLFTYIDTPGANNFSLFFQYIGPKTAAHKGLGPKEKRGIVEVIPW